MVWLGQRVTNRLGGNRLSEPAALITVRILEPTQASGGRFGSNQPNDPRAPAGTPLSVSDLNRNVQLIGRLGHPLGELLTIRGVWFTEPSLNGGSWFCVFRVNETALETPVEFSGASLHDLTGKVLFRQLSRLETTASPATGEVWELRGVEAGGYVGEPPSLANQNYETAYTKFEPPTSRSECDIGSREYRFETWFRHIQATRIK
jgi:hypothetical protein